MDNKEAINWLTRIRDRLMTTSSKQFEAMTMAIAALEQQEPMKGKWIKHEHGYWSYVNEHGERDGWIPDYECSICGSRGWKNAEIGLMHFCPSCGAILEGIRK